MLSGGETVPSSLMEALCGATISSSCCHLRLPGATNDHALDFASAPVPAGKLLSCPQTGARYPSLLRFPGNRCYGRDIR